jgi:quinol monooxygenase YgiN
MIHVIATIKAQPGNLGGLIQAFREIQPVVKKKVGCVEYGLALHLKSDLPGQGEFDPNEIIIVEKWTGIDALNAHISDAGYQEWFTNVWDLVAGASMQILEATD